MDSQNDRIDDNTKDDIRKVLSEYYKNDSDVIKQIEDILNYPEYDKKYKEYIKNHSDELKSKVPGSVNEVRNVLNNADISNKKEETDMADETKTTEQTTDQVKNDTTSKKIVNPFNREHLADILWDASIKHPFITLGLISGVCMIGGIKLTEHVISRGVHMGNMKTLKSIYRMTH